MSALIDRDVQKEELACCSMLTSFFHKLPVPQKVLPMFKVDLPVLIYLIQTIPHQNPSQVKESLIFLLLVLYLLNLSSILFFQWRMSIRQTSIKARAVTIPTLWKDNHIRVLSDIARSWQVCFALTSGTSIHEVLCICTDFSTRHNLTLDTSFFLGRYFVLESLHGV